MSFDAAATVAALCPWDVVYPFDDRIHPAKHKMWVCVSRDELWFLRINSRRYDECCVSLPSARHSFLQYDSFFGAGGDLITAQESELEILLGRQMDFTRQGVIGEIHAAVRPPVPEAERAAAVTRPWLPGCLAVGPARCGGRAG